jgi:hypothetical protein
MIVIESREDAREIDGAATRTRVTAPLSALYLIDTVAIRNEAKLLKIKRRAQL